MIDYAELVLRLKQLEREYHDCMLQNKKEQALLASEELVVIAKRIQAYTQAIAWIIGTKTFYEQSASYLAKSVG